MYAKCTSYVVLYMQFPSYSALHSVSFLRSGLYAQSPVRRVGERPRVLAAQAARAPAPRPRLPGGILNVSLESTQSVCAEEGNRLKNDIVGRITLC